MRVLIVDDEPNARNRLQIMLEELDVEVVGEAANGMEALEMVESLRPDLLLLDIQMPEVDGFDVARHLPDGGPLVVFQTAHDEFALKAFDHEALDYLVKPVSLKRLAEALERARRRVGAADPIAYSPELIEQLRAAVAGSQPAGSGRLLVRDGRGHRLLPVERIHVFVAREGEVYAVTEDKEFMVDYTLAELEDRLASGFTRANRSDLVSITHVEKFVMEGGGSARLLLATGAEVRVSRRRAGEVKQRLERLS